MNPTAALTLAASLAFSALASAQPTTQPTTQPDLGSVQVQPGAAGHPIQSPVETYIHYTEFARKADAKAMLNYYKFDNEGEKKVAEQLIAADITLARLAQATFSKFGEAAMVKEQQAIGDARPEGMTSKVVTAEGIAIANLSDVAGNPVVSMISSDRRWKIFLSPLIKFWETPDKLLAEVNRQKSKAEQLTENLNAGKYKTIEDLLAAINAK